MQIYLSILDQDTCRKSIYEVQIKAPNPKAIFYHLLFAFSVCMNTAFHITHIHNFLHQPQESETLITVIHLQTKHEQKAGAPFTG